MEKNLKIKSEYKNWKIFQHSSCDEASGRR